MFSCLQILEAFLWFVLITLLNLTLIILTLSVSRLLIFFFRAEDGIRYIGVTGVQTCALPISLERRHPQGVGHADEHGPDTAPGGERRARSEERRVGKECRSRWSPYH